MSRFDKYLARHLCAGCVLILLALATSCLAGEARYGVRGIHHSSWTSENGVSAVFEIQQDSHGYLWLNTANGVVRFDGVRFQSLEEATNNALRSSDITSACSVGAHLLHNQNGRTHVAETLPACRNRKVAMSELVDPTVSLEFYQISSRGKKLPEDADEFSAFLKKYIARWAGEAGAL